jgi:hypothetical protein
MNALAPGRGRHQPFVPRRGFFAAAVAQPIRDPGTAVPRHRCRDFNAEAENPTV